MTRQNPITCSILLTVLVGLQSADLNAADSDKFSPQKGDHIVLIGNTLAERMQHFGHCETLLHLSYPDKNLVVRNLGWSADELTLRPRSKDFQDHGHTLQDHKPDAIFAFFGFNESFAGPAGLKKFESDLTSFIKTTTSTKYNGKNPPTLVLFTPIPQEDTGRTGVTDGKANNNNMALYSKAMQEIAKKQGVLCVDLFNTVKPLMEDRSNHLTFNGIHLTDEGFRKIAPIFIRQLAGAVPQVSSDKYERLRAEVNEKNLQHWYDYRAINGYYIYGGRKEPFGVVNFPAEFEKLRNMIALRDQRVWNAAQGKRNPAVIDDSQTGEVKPVETNIKFEISITPPEEAAETFSLPAGYEINLFASEVDFPNLQNPCQFAFDAKGRIWVTTMPTYPMYMPSKPVEDKVLILEDTNGDGTADKSTIFADGLHVPTGIELGDGGAYVAQQPNVVFLKDTNGDDQADSQQIVLHGFDSADSHHAISAFEWGPGGGLYFQEGTFHHTQVETPYGPKRVKNAAVFRYEPKTEKFDIFVSYGFANPWGHVFDKWGQNFVADASPGANYYGTAFSGQVDYPRKHPKMKQFLVKQWRPTCGNEIVSSRNFPKETQGDYLLNNCIGFQGVLQYRMKENDSGFEAEPVEPLLRSADRNFRPVDLQFGPDGALYVLDWFNPLIGHMQHSIRDPNRDTNHGRIWRIHYTGNKLVPPAKIAGEPIPALLDLLKTYEDRTRFRARRELRLHKTADVVNALNKWIAGLNKAGKMYQHQLLEALWVRQHHNAVDAALLKQLLTSPDYKVRAAATRVLCYWRDQVKEPLELLRTLVNDEHPRVRLEAVRALSFFDSNEALEIAVESLIHPQDDYLKYALNETMATLEVRIKQKEQLSASK